MRTIHLFILAALFCCLSFVQTAMATGWLSTQNNRIYSADGTIWMGRGANLHDTRSCNACAWQQPSVAETKRRIDELVDVWGANFIRLCLESYPSQDGRVQWQSVLNDPEYLSDIKEIVDYIGTKNNVYVLLSLWLDPSFSEMGWPTATTYQTWEKLVPEFIDTPYVLFGLVNEPQENYDGALDSEVWTAMNNGVAAIRAIEAQYNGHKHIVTVQGVGNWARRLDYYVTHPITAGNGENIAYEVHVYDNQPLFQSMVTTPSRTLPIIIGEFGPAEGYMTLEASADLMDLADQLQIPYLGWSFHMRCPPNLLVDHSDGGCGIDMPLEPTPWGQLLKDRLTMYKEPLVNPDTDADRDVDGVDLKALIDQYNTTGLSANDLKNLATRFGDYLPSTGVPQISILYNGEDIPYASGTHCDTNDSTIGESSVAPYSGTKHIRATINVANWWGAVGYAPGNWLPIDSSDATLLRFAAKADTPVNMIVQLFNTQTGANSSFQTVSLSSSYQLFQLPINFESFNMITFAVSVGGTTAFTVDIDDLALE